MSYFAFPHVASKRFVTVGLLLSVMVACTDESPFGPQYQSLDAAEARWDAARPASNSYVMEQQVSCFCATGSSVYSVTVVSGIVTEAKVLTSGAVVPASVRAQFRTVDQLFDAVRKGLRTPFGLTDVVYDPMSGYPTTVALDPIRQAADDEVTYFTNRVLPLP